MKTDTDRGSTYVGRETGSNWRAPDGTQTLVEVEDGYGSNARTTIFSENVRNVRFMADLVTLSVGPALGLLTRVAHYL